MVAAVLYKKGVYLGLARKDKLPFVPSSILDNLETSALGSPSTVPETSSAIWVALNFIGAKLRKISVLFRECQEVLVILSREYGEMCFFRRSIE